MEHETLFGFRPLTEPNSAQTQELVAGGTIFRHSIVDLAADGTVTCRADDEATDAPFGVALNYAVAGENVIICRDQNMRYLTTYTLDPDDVAADFGQFMITVDNDTAKDAMNPYINKGGIGTASASYTHGTHSVQLLGWYKNPAQTYTGASQGNLVIVRVLSEYGSAPSATAT